MTTSDLNFTLSYQGERADDNEIDLYDVAQALIGFQRSLYIESMNRAIPFELAESARDEKSVMQIMENFSINTRARFQKKGYRILKCLAFSIKSHSGQLKKFLITEVMDDSQN